MPLTREEFSRLGTATQFGGDVYKVAGRTLRLRRGGTPGEDVYEDVAGAAGATGTEVRFPRSPALFGEDESRLTRMLTEVPETSSLEDIREEKRKAAQASIDAIRGSFNRTLEAEMAAGAGREARTRASNVGAGLSGSDFATSAAVETERGNRKAVAAIEAERDAKIQAILGNIEKESSEQFTKEREFAQTQAEGALTQIQAFRERAKGNAANLAKSGASLTKLKKEQPELYDTLLKTTGLSELEFDSYFTASIPQGEILDKFKAGGKYIVIRRLPSGELQRSEIALPEGALGDDVTFTIAPDGTPLIFNKTTGKAQIAGGFKEGQFSAGKFTVTTDALGNPVAFDTRTGKFGGGGGAAPSGPPKSSDDPQAKTVLDLVNNLTFGSKDERQTTLRTVTERLNAGDYDGARRKVQAFVYNKMNPEKQQSFDANDNAGEAYREALSLLDSGNVEAGPYKTLIESKKPYALLQKDPAYVELRNLIGLAETPIRKANFGTALTPQELVKSQDFLFNENDDINAVRQKIENAVAFYSFVNDSMVARATGAPKPQLNDYLNVGAGDRVEVVAPDGAVGTIPRSQLEEAQGQGYTLKQ